MQKRSGKIEFLFWSAFFAVLFALWIALILLNGFGSPLSDATIKLLFVLYFFVGISSLAGLLLAMLINNRFYERLFSAIIFFLFLTLLAVRSFSD